MGTTCKPARYILRGEFVASRLDAAHIRHREFAAQIGICGSYLSQVMHGHRVVSPDVRRAIADHPIFVGVDEALLWDIKPPQFEQMALPCVGSPDAELGGVA